jgi:peptide/nickel transport system substrate-binding protein
MAVVARVILLGSVVALAAVTALVESGPAADLRVLGIVSSQDVDSLDPGLATSHVFLPIVTATCSKLYELRDGDDAPRPEVASGYPRVSADRRTYTFTVREGFRFSDGRPVTAATFAAAIERVRRPEMRSPWAAFTGDIASVRARGATLTLTLRRAVGDLVSRLASSWSCPVPSSLPPDPLGAERIPGSGPYTVVSHTPGREVVLRRNAFYRGTRQRRPDSIVITIGGTVLSTFADVEAGRFDYVQNVWLPPPPAQLVSELTGRYGVNRTRFFARPALGTVYLALNTERPLFRANPRLRRAVNLALDRAEILRQAGMPHGRRTDRLLPAGMPGFARGHLYPVGKPDLVAAKRLAAGNLRNGHAVLYAADEPIALRRAGVIRQNLAQMGLDVEVKAFPRPVLVSLAAQRGAPFDLIETGWHAHYADPSEFLVSLLAGPLAPRDNLNLSYFTAADEVIRSAHRSPAPERYRRLGLVELDVMRRFAPVAPLFHPFNYALVSSRVGCFSTAALAVDYGSFCLT